MNPKSGYKKFQRCYDDERFFPTQKSCYDSILKVFVLFDVVMQNDWLLRYSIIYLITDWMFCSNDEWMNVLY